MSVPLLVAAGCGFPGGHGPEIRFEAASLSPGDCVTNSVRSVDFFAQLSSTEGVLSVRFFEPPDVHHGVAAPDADGVVDASFDFVEGTMFDGWFEAVAEGGKVLARSDPLTFTVPACD